jgi:hypothetical protein
LDSPEAITISTKRDERKEDGKRPFISSSMASSYVLLDAIISSSH